MNGYFDANATTPLLPAARDAWNNAPWFNPSSLYAGAATAREHLEDCRHRLAAILECEAGDLIFLSGATEANNAVLHFFRSRGLPCVVSAIEHPSIREAAEGAPNIAVRADGVVCMERLQSILKGADKPALVSLMAANNETGVLQPWREALGLCQAAGVAFHCDAAQWLGKLPAAGLGSCDFLTGSAHKFGGPKGVGFLKATGPFRWLRGGPQEERRRAGTENLPGIAAMIAALEASETALRSHPPGESLRMAFESRIKAALPGIQIVGDTAPRLWNTVMLVMPHGRNIKWLARLSRLGFQVSTGSACSSGGGASEILAAMGLPAEAMNRVIRVSSTASSTAEDWNALASAFEAVATSMPEDGPGLP